MDCPDAFRPTACMPTWNGRLSGSFPGQPKEWTSPVRKFTKPKRRAFVPKRFGARGRWLVDGGIGSRRWFVVDCVNAFLSTTCMPRGMKLFCQ